MGYLLGKLTAKMVQQRLNIPLLLMLSVLPDIDLLIPLLPHRGPLHSLLLYGIISIPLLVAFRLQSVPYLTALATHSLVDILGWEPAQLLWPLNTTPVYLNLLTRSQIAIIELDLFLLAASLLILDRETTRDSSPLTGVLIIPLTALAVPVISGRPIPPPAILIFPHVAMILLLVFALGTAGLTLCRKVLNIYMSPLSRTEPA
jgi:membrane-bound metal-dependent hydrolase YbcI (DUF457 family)